MGHRCSGQNAAPSRLLLPAPPKSPPVSTIVQWSMKGLVLLRVCTMKSASFLTIIVRPSVGARGASTCSIPCSDA